jgi:hypothetical protein
MQFTDLLSVLIDGESFKCQIPARSVMWLNRAWEIERRLHSQICNCILQDLEVNGNYTGHLNGSAERDLAITLRKMHCWTLE